MEKKGENEPFWRRKAEERRRGSGELHDHPRIQLLYNHKKIKTRIIKKEKERKVKKNQKEREREREREREGREEPPPRRPSQQRVNYMG